MNNNYTKPGVIVIEGHVQGLANVRILGREGIPVYVVDKNKCIAQYSKYCRKYFKCPDYQSKEFIDFLLEIHKKESLQNWLLLPSNDHAVYNISKNKEVLSTLYSVMTEEFNVITKVYNKRELLKLAEHNGIPTPKTIIPIDNNPQSVALRYPIMIKGNNGLSFYKKYRTKAVIISDQKELVQVFAKQFRGIRPEEYFIQEVLSENNKTVSVAVFSIKGEVYTYWMGVKLREHPDRFGTATCCKSIFVKELKNHVAQLIKILNYTGVCEIEFIKDSQDNEYKLIEINARTWLWVALAAKCGINYPLYIYKHMLGEAYQYPQDYKNNVYWINFITDTIYSGVALIKGKLDLKEYYKTFRVALVDALYEKKDIKPFFAYLLLSFSMLKNR